MAETPHRRRQIPWQDVIKHHKEITRRAEEEFFSLPTSQTDSERWTSLIGAPPVNFAGPWKLQHADIKSVGMQRSIKAEGITEFFLGCSCWHALKKVGDKWFIDWRPAVYRQVEVLIDGDEVILKPAQGKWEFSPLVFSLLDKKSAHPAHELDDWLPQLLESAYKHHETTGVDLAAALIEIFSRDLPALGDEIQKQFPPDKKILKPSQWILFSPPPSTAAVNQHLMADYKRIESRLEADAKDIGGFHLFEDVKAFPDQQIDLLPIVALNESQRVAVSNILQGKPVTVISGPPGCGKSQVVVSALLNAWAKGTTVVFASNNNKAVDVVRERIKRFEEDFPIAVRAGSRRESNLEEALRQALNVVTDVGRKKGSDESANKQKKLSDTRKTLQQFIDSNIPQRIDQSLKSAINAYSKYLETSQLLNEKDQSIRKVLTDMHYKMKAESFETELLAPFREWLDEADDVRLSISTTEREHVRLEAELKLTKTMRDGACQKAGLEPQQITSWEWLISGPSPDILRVWRDKLRETLNKPLEGSLGPIVWDGSYDRWNGSAETKKWASESNKHLTEVRNAVNRLSPIVSQIKAAQAKYKSQQQSLHESGIPDNVAPDHTVISSWMALFAEHTTAPASNMDWLPWSPHKKRDRQLQQLEKQLRPVFPISIWQRIGVLNNEGRSALGTILEKCQVWSEVQRLWQEMETNLLDVENTYFLMRTKASTLGFTNAPKSTETADWEAFETEIAETLAVAEAAEKAWKKMEEKDATIAYLRSLVVDFESHGSGIPLKEEWKKGRGLQLDSALKALGDTPSAETLVVARTALYTAPLDDFLTCWDEARNNEELLRKLCLDLSRLPSNDHLIETWWKRHPKPLPADIVKFPRLPDHDDLLFAHLTSCSAWQESWEQFRDNDRPQLQKIISEESSWAREALGKVIESLPTEYSDKAKTLVQNVLTNSKSDWPTDELLNAFSEFGPEAIKARIEGIDQELEALSFTFARDEWIGKLSEDVELQETLSKLLNNFERKRGRIEEADYELFRSALKAVPIWITTAQATQSIPLLPELFDLLIIDEATQCTVTNLLPLVYRAKHIAVIGDKEQLEAITSLSPAAENVLASSFGVDHLLDLLGHTKNTVYGAFVQCLPRRYSDVIALDEHYRSHPLIIGFANEHVYKKKLRLKKDPSQGVRIPTGAGLFCKDVEGICQRDKRGQSWQNQQEADAVVETIRGLRSESQFARFSLGVVTPFKAQVDLVSEQLDKEGLLSNILVGTAHSFQGDERDVIIFSSVVSKGITEGAATWVEKPPNLINVAVTRAREALFLVGNLSCCRQQPGILGKLAAYAEEVETLRSTSQEELELFSWMVIQGWAPEVHPVIGDIEVDFTIKHEGRKIAVEVDGTQHDWNTVADSARDAYLKGKGFMVIRIPARAVREAPAVCIEKIEHVMQTISQ
ncbi:putative helicase senataxin [Geobacter sp. OR-1]|uniref:AAA domain-containing protein n=1 Tax=Geobacter sp. OR-1 TaxID=1266765 RepID=UPI0005439C99|nr:AAA domain-containing protein [Geobacter sp. OR-1]GAM10438.1 putative helicase senataxin [Geobacter sp. OR-1]